MKSILSGLLILFFCINSISVFASESELDQKSHFEMAYKHDDCQFEPFDAYFSNVLKISKTDQVDRSSQSLENFSETTSERLNRLFAEADLLFWRKLKQRLSYDVIKYFKTLFKDLDSVKESKP